jgi:peptidyl-tRNA hydrolase, PTH1 family
MKLIVGLGNIGRDYQNTRHNIGFMVLDALLAKIDPGASWRESKRDQAWQADVEWQGEKLLLIKPTTLMNRSGQAVAAILRYNEISPANIWVVQDEIDLEFGRLKVAQGGGSAGHHGVESIMDVIGKEFGRWRCGVGKPPQKQKLTATEGADYVLGNFSATERQFLVEEFIPAVVETILEALANGLDKANDFFYKKISRSMPMETSAKGGRKA